MSLRYYISFIFFAFLLLSCSAQKLKTIIKTVNKTSLQTIFNDSVLSFIQTNNDFVFGYRDHNETWKLYQTYFLIGYKKNKLTAYKYSKKYFAVNNEKDYQLQEFFISESERKALNSFLKKTKIWKVKHNEKDDEAYCPLKKEYSYCNISDASSKDLIISTKSHQQISDFYAPEYFEKECCPGNIDRQKILMLIEIFGKIFNEIK